MKDLKTCHSMAKSVYVSGSNVYVVGCEEGGAILWTNGVSRILACGKASAKSVFVSGNDIFVVGYEGRKAILWKNEVKQKLSIREPLFQKFRRKRASANGVYVLGNDIYIVGYVGNTAVLWKNGVSQKLSAGSREAKANSVCVSGSDVYVAGYEGSIAKLWKNGVAQNLSDESSDTEFTVETKANSVYVLEGNVYVAGYEEIKRNQDGFFRSYLVAILWKNGVRQNLTDKNYHYAMATSVFVSGNDVYVAGMECAFKEVNSFYRTEGPWIAKLWKNGIGQNLRSSMEARALSVYIYGCDAYVAGYEDENEDEDFGGEHIRLAKLWKNGEIQNLTFRQYKPLEPLEYPY